MFSGSDGPPYTCPLNDLLLTVLPEGSHFKLYLEIAGKENSFELLGKIFLVSLISSRKNPV